MPNGRKSLRYALLAGTALSAQPLAAGELPAGPSVLHGSVGITTPDAGRMAIQQSSNSAIVAWKGFSIGTASSVDIRQPSASSAILNRVTGADPSNIAGRLTANGRVYLVNPNGIAISPTGSVRAGAFVASTLDIADDDFLAGRREFAAGGHAAQVTNQGTIEIGRGGYAALLGGKVDNSGTISVPVGRIGLGAGRVATLDLSGDGFLSVAMPPEDEAEDALVSHSGRLSADGGRVEISAATARHAARHAINLSGVIEARTVSGQSGNIVLGGGQGGSVTVSGRLDASAAEPSEAASAVSPLPQARPETAMAGGGSIVVTGAEIALAGAELDASGAAGGGTVRVGGDLKGGGTLQRARTVSVDAATRISADALASGDGGNVVLWSDELTTFEGGISARGGPAGGDGGFAEVSGRERLRFTGAADLSAAAGTPGHLLLDPRNILIAFGGDVEPGALSTALQSGDVTLSTSAPPDLGEPGDITVDAFLAWSSANTLTLDADGTITFTPAIPGEEFSGAELDAPNGGLVLNWGQNISFPADLSVDVANLTLDGPADWGALTATGFDEIDPDNLTINSAITGSGPVGLTEVTSTVTINGPIDLPDDLLVQAGDAIVFNGPVSVDGTLALQTLGTITTGPAASLDAGGFFLSIGSWQQNGSNIPSFSADDFLVSEDASFLRAAGGSGTGGDPYLISDVYGLQGMDTSGFSTASFALIQDIDAGGTAGWNAGAGFDPIGEPQVEDTPFGGTFDGQGNTINGLVINQPGSSDPVGLFGQVAGGADIRNVELADVNIVGGNETGALVGSLSTDSLVENVLASGSVSGENDVGGLVGAHVEFLFFPPELEFPGSDQVGEDPLDSQSNDQGPFTIRSAFADVEVSGENNVGGLVGFNEGTIELAYASGSVNGSGVTGGLVGFNNGGTLNQTYAVGPVAGGGGNDLIEGGLVGDSSGGQVLASFWDVETTNQASSAGGTDLTTAEFQDTEDFVALAGPLGWNFGTTWAPPRAELYPALYALEPVVNVIPGDATAVRGSTDDLMLDATVVGGPGVFLFGPDEDSVEIGDILSSDGIPESGMGPFPNVGMYDIVAAPSVTSDEGIVYDVVAAEAQLAITPAPLTIAALDTEKPFGEVLQSPSTQFSVDGLLAGDTVASVVLTSEGAAADAPVSGSPYLLFPSGPQGVGLFAGEIDNYLITFEPGALTVTPPVPQSPTEGPDAPSSRFIPPIELPNPDDAIAYGGGSGGGPIVALPGGRTESLAAAEETLEFLEMLAGDLDSAVEACQRSQPEVEGYLDCLGTSLDQYAAQIDTVALALPEPLRAVSATIQQASREIAEARDTAVRQLATARTPAERTRIRRQAAARARAAIETATTEIRKQIALIRADEPQIARLQVEQGDAITAALDNVGTKLERVVGL